MRSLLPVALTLLPSGSLAFAPGPLTSGSPAAAAVRRVGTSSSSSSSSSFSPVPLRESTSDDAVAAASSSSEEEKEPTISVAPVEPGSHEELMYALGVNLARQIGDVRPLVENGDELTQVARGLLDTVIGRFDELGQAKLLSERKADLNNLVTERATRIRDKLVEAGKEMLQEMADTDGVEALKSGVMLHVVDSGPDGPGQGTRPTKSSTVKVHYHGTLPDGTIFDSTLGDEPVSFALGQVIPGWRDALLAMHEGETAMVGIPPDMGYGEEGSPDGRIPGGATLFFKIQLLEVLTAGIGGSPTLLGADGKKLGKDEGGKGSGLLGVDGMPL